MGLFTRRTLSPKGSGSKVTETRNRKTGKTTRTLSSKSGGYRTSRNMSTGKVRKTKLW
jgi:hypothetical protein